MRYPDDPSLSSDVSDSDSESDYIEDEDGELVTPAIDAQILRTLAEIRARDQKIYDPQSKFFDEHELKNAEEAWVKRKLAEGEKVTLTDYQRQRLLSGKLVDEEEEEEYYDEEEEQPLTHFEEQENLKKAFKSALEMSEDEEADDLFTKRPKTAEQLAKEEEDYRSFLLENLSKSENARESMGDWLSYKADNGQAMTSADPEERFLIDYVLSRGWVDQEKRTVPDYERIIEEDEQDLEAVERAEEYETALNFRFEQPGADQIATYARDIEGTLRRPDSKRKEQRAAKKARKEAEALQHKEDVKRRKNELKLELRKRLAKIQKVADLKAKDVSELDEALDLDDSDFDQEEHDKKMAKLFNDDFYGAEDNERPVFSSEDEYDCPPADEDEEFMHAVWNGGEEEVSNDHAGDSEEDEFAPKIIERKTKAKSGDKTAISRIKDELYKLDCEDVIGRDEDAIKCRFRYTSVLPTSFGLEPKEILAADETLLNQHVSLKKLAPYRPLERQREDAKKLGDKRRVYMLRKKMWDAAKAEREARKAKKASKKDKKMKV